MKITYSVQPASPGVGPDVELTGGAALARQLLSEHFDAQAAALMGMLKSSDRSQCGGPVHRCKNCTCPVGSVICHRMC